MKTKYPLFMHVCWFLTDIGLVKVSGWLRRAAHNHVAVSRTGAFEYGTYQNPDQIGYKGWLDLDGFGTVAFERLDGTLQYEW